MIKILPYLKLMRLDKPIGAWLLLFPCLWSLALAYSPLYDFYHGLYLGGLFFAGAFVMRGAGCVYNDILDCEIDKQVARTACRPLPSGEITKTNAYIFLIILLLIGGFILIHFNITTVILGLLSLGLVLLYPIMKLTTNYPQLWLGLTFNWGALLGWTALRSSIDMPALMIYIGGIFWTLGYDTIYAYQDKEDDLKIGVKSTAITFGSKAKPFLYTFYGLTLIMFIAGGYMVNLSYGFYILMTFPAMHLFWQVKTLDIDNGGNCLNRFKSNQWFGLMVLLSIIAGKLL